MSKKLVAYFSASGVTKKVAAARRFANKLLFKSYPRLDPGPVEHFVDFKTVLQARPAEVVVLFLHSADELRELRYHPLLLEGLLANLCPAVPQLQRHFSNDIGLGFTCDKSLRALNDAAAVPVAVLGSSTDRCKARIQHQENSAGVNVSLHVGEIGNALRLSEQPHHIMNIVKVEVHERPARLFGIEGRRDDPLLEIVIAA